MENKKGHGKPSDSKKMGDSKKANESKKVSEPKKASSTETKKIKLPATKPIKPATPPQSDEEDDEEDDVVDFSKISDEDDDQSTDDNSNTDGEHLVADDENVFDLDQFKKGSFFDQEAAEKAFTAWKAKRTRQQPEWFVKAVNPTVDESEFSKTQRNMTLKLIDSYKAKLKLVQDALAEPDLSARESKRLTALKSNYEKVIQSRMSELK